MSEYALLNEPLHAPLAQWREAVQSEGIEFPGELDIAIRIHDVGEKIGLATLSKREDWEAYFDAFEINAFDRDSLIDALLDWMDADATPRPFGAEAEDYRTRGLSILPANGPPMTIAELEHVMGFADLWWETPGQPSALAQTMQATLSPLHSIPPNINTADLAVLRYLTGDDFRARDIYAFRIGNDLEPGTEDDYYFKDEADLEKNGFFLERPASFAGELFVVEVSVRSEGGRFNLSALVSMNKEDRSETPSLGAFELIRSSENYRFSSNRGL